ncbi:Gamma-tubulin complex component 6 [Umbelopsis sp. WA50703]
MVDRFGGYERLTLMQLYYSIDELDYILDQLITLLSSAASSMSDHSDNTMDGAARESSTNLIQGPKLIDLIYSKLQSLEATKTDGYPHLLKNILSALLAKSSLPYFTFIHRWLGINPERSSGYGNLDALMYHQNLRTIDPHREFFIQDTSETRPSVTGERQSGNSLDVYLSDFHSDNLSSSVDNKNWHQRSELDDSLRPSFISYELAVDILETGKSLRLLRNLFQEDYSSFENYIKNFIDDVEMQESLPGWKFVTSPSRKITTNRDATRLSQDVRSGLNSHEHDTSETNGQCHQGSKHTIEDSLISPRPKRRRSSKILQTDVVTQHWPKVFALPEMQTPDLSPFLELLQSLQISELSQHEDNDTADYIPPLNIVIFNSIERPLLRLCRSLNASVIAYFLNDLKLLSYVQALRDYFAMGNGDFYTNTVTTLFRSDPASNSQGGLIGPTMTKIGHGRRLPPSSIELRTALNDIFLRSTEEFDVADKKRVTENSEYAGRFISFCIRDDIDQGLEWTNPHGLEATDFLKLAYSPPYPLNALITPTIVEKYNRVFTYLLKIIRARTLVQDIHRLMHHRSSRSQTHNNVYQSIEPLRFQMTQFLDALHGYVFDGVIAMNWKVYMQRLHCLTKINHIKQDAENSVASGGKEIDCFIVDLDTMKVYNEYFVELLLHQCILKKKQQGIQRVIESLLTCAISLSAMLTDFDAVCYNDREPTENEVKKLHRHCSKLADRFRGQMTVLVDLLVSLKTRDSGDIRFAIDQRRMSKVQMFTEYHEKAFSEDGAINCFERLLLRLDFNGYYQTVK